MYEKKILMYLYFILGCNIFHGIKIHNSTPNTSHRLTRGDQQIKNMSTVSILIRLVKPTLLSTMSLHYGILINK